MRKRKNYEIRMWNLKPNPKHDPKPNAKQKPQPNLQITLTLKSKLKPKIPRNYFLGAGTR